MSTHIQSSTIKLSICIPTYNRAAMLAATLDNLIGQVTDECEVVISDNASTDDTEKVAARFAQRFERLRYIKQGINNGFDHNTDSVVELARGEYCWLVPDDDVPKEGAIAAILEALRSDYSLVVVNAEIIDVHTSKVMWPRRPDIAKDRVLRREELDALFEVAGEQLTYLAAVVIKRAVWLERERKRYYGTLLTFFAVVFQKPLPNDALVMARPLILHKFGNQTWLANSVEMLSKYDSLIDSLAISESLKEKARNTKGSPHDHGMLLVYRAMGCYTLMDYRRWIRPHLHSPWETLLPRIIALLPGKLVHLCLVSYLSVTRGNHRELLLALLRNSSLRAER